LRNCRELTDATRSAALLLLLWMAQKWENKIAASA